MCLSWDCKVMASAISRGTVDCKNRLIVFLLGGQITQWFLSMALQLLTSPSGLRSNVENKFHMPQYVTHYLGTGTWTFFSLLHCFQHHWGRVYWGRSRLSGHSIRTPSKLCVRQGQGESHWDLTEDRFTPPSYWLYTVDFRVLRWHCQCQMVSPGVIRLENCVSRIVCKKRNTQALNRKGQRNLWFLRSRVASS